MVTYCVYNGSLAETENQLFSQLVFLGEVNDLLATFETAPSEIKKKYPFLQWDELTAIAKTSLKPTYDSGSSTDTWYHLESSPSHELLPFRVTLAALPSKQASRHNCFAKPHAATDLIRGCVKPVDGKGALVIVCSPTLEHILPLGCAIPRAFPLYSAKTSSTPQASDEKVHVVFLPVSNSLLLKDLPFLAENIQTAARLIDTPPNIMHTTQLTEEAIEIHKNLQEKYNRKDAQICIIKGEELATLGLGGLYGVGKASVHPPALVMLSINGNDPTFSSEPEKSICLVGKGIVYDTGGLSIKTKDGMPGMKGDMGGSAAVLCAFNTLAQTGYKATPLYALLCVAENSVDSRSTRPDDVHTFYSGKTVEVNNTDAEGRLVLGDGVAWAVKHLNPAYIFDMATLTGAQLIATGLRHAGILSNCEETEKTVVDCGKMTGDLTHPLPYCPEFFLPEFKSKVADLKNSVKCRTNAQSSCAGHFIEAHLMNYYDNGGKWVHIDMAGPADSGERGTGYGVALMYSVVNNISLKMG